MIGATRWSELETPLSQSVLKTLKHLKFDYMTPVQASTIPLLLSHKDVAVEALTGSGKTLAFVIPVIEILQRRREVLGKFQVGALVVSPTRELALQISRVFSEFLDRSSDLLRQLLVIGGNRKVSSDIEKFKNHGANIIIGTPGRIEDIFMGKSGSQFPVSALRTLEILVLDEADCLLNSGFEQALNTIIAFLPKQRRTGLFSATQTKDVDKLIRAGLRNPVLVLVNESMHANVTNATPSSLENFYVILEPAIKLAYLVEFLKQNKNQKCLVFFSTGASVEYFALVLKRILKNEEVGQIFALHRKKQKRHQIFDSFRRQVDGGVLICTDVVARGIDVPLVDWVIQFDAPSNAESFVHRCGRTARSGHKGSALLFLMPSEGAYVDFIRINQKVQLGIYSDKTLPHESIYMNVINSIRDWQRNDRSVFDKANRAFVSFIMAYTKHECRWILRTKDLDFAGLANCYALIKMPRMPEIKNNESAKKFQVMPSINFNDIKYKDKQKEKSRQKKLTIYQTTGKWPGTKSELHWNRVNAPWSITLDRKEKKIKNRNKSEKRANKKDLVLEEDNDREELEEDFRLLKKLKKGRITQEQYDREIDLVDALDGISANTS